uniref:TIR domain-containing protein n=1 Tax=Ciona savignyi TaxID=51511 RepID=H2YDC7_CIOSA
MDNYDVHVVCHENELKIVCNELLSILEEILELRCFLLERDGRAGMSVVHSIEACLHNSRRTIVCFSDAFMSSSWKQYETLLAHQLDPSRIIPIIFGVFPQIAKFQRNIRELHHCDGRMRTK